MFSGKLSQSYSLKGKNHEKIILFTIYNAGFHYNQR
jgi:hypothetical protein